MVRVIGPTVPRWQLGEQLTQLWERSGIDYSKVADLLDCSSWKVRRIADGKVGVAKQELKAILDQIGLEEDSDQRRYLEDLQQQGKQRGWWSRYNKHISSEYADFLGLESAATVVRTWEPIVVPGLLQTEAYARALAEAGRLTEDQVARDVEIRMTRQALLWKEEPPEGWYTIDESVLTRVVGGLDVMREQLHQLLDMSRRCTIQVMPLRTGAHPGTAGSLTMFEFPDDLHSPIACVENQAGTLYVEDDDIARTTLVLQDLSAAALSPHESRTLIRDIAAREYTKRRGASPE